MAVTLAAVLWAMGGTVARALIDDGASAVELTEARAWISAVGLGAIVLPSGRGVRRRAKARVRFPWSGGSPPEPPVRSGGPPLREGRVRFPWSGGSPPEPPAPRLLIVVFGLAIAAANVSYYLSLERLPVAVAIVVQYTAPGLVVLWSAAALRRRPSAKVLWALGLALFGVVLLSGIRKAGGGLNPAGLAIAAAAAFAFATYMVTGENVGRRMGTVRGMFWGFVVASVFWAGVQALRGRPDTLLDTRFWPGVLFLAVFTTIAPFTLFLWGLGRIEASRAGIVSTLEPVTAAVLAWVWLGQSLGAEQVIGGAMVVAGIAIVQSEGPRSALSPPSAGPLRRRGSPPEG